MPSGQCRGVAGGACARSPPARETGLELIEQFPSLDVVGVAAGLDQPVGLADCRDATAFATSRAGYAFIRRLLTSRTRTASFAASAVFSEIEAHLMELTGDRCAQIVPPSPCGCSVRAYSWNRTAAPSSFSAREVFEQCRAFGLLLEEVSTSAFTIPSKCSTLRMSFTAARARAVCPSRRPG